MHHIYFWGLRGKHGTARHTTFSQPHEEWNILLNTNIEYKICDVVKSDSAGFVRICCLFCRTELDLTAKQRGNMQVSLCENHMKSDICDSKVLDIFFFACEKASNFTFMAQPEWTFRGLKSFSGFLLSEVGFLLCAVRSRFLDLSLVKSHKSDCLANTLTECWLVCLTFEFSVSNLLLLTLDLGEFLTFLDAFLEANHARNIKISNTFHKWVHFNSFTFSEKENLS